MNNETKNDRPLRRSIRVHFSNGDTITTAINGTVEEIRRYYAGNVFNIGSGGDDLLAMAIKVEFLD